MMEDSDTKWVHFTRTHWSLISSAKSANSTESREAMESLCRSYWLPIYAYIRRRGYRSQEAQDLTQDFFAQLLEKGFLQNVTRAKGKFRSFLLACVNHLLSHERDKRQALKRGGNSPHIAFEDLPSVEAELVTKVEPNDWNQTFDYLWTRTVLKRASQSLKERYQSRGKAEMFETLKSLALRSDEESTYQSVASELGLQADALRAAVHRMRVMMGRLIREEVSHTLSEPGDLEPEIRYLIDVIAKN